MTDYNPAHYMAGAWPTSAEAVIYCTRCESPNAIIYSIAPDAKVDDRYLDRIINATRQHHDDHHEGK